MNKKNWPVVIIIILIVVLVRSCNKNTSPVTSELIQTKLPMGYIPDIQQAPVYVADHLGLFEKTGYEFSFDYSFETDGMALVAAGEVPFAFRFR